MCSVETKTKKTQRLPRVREGLTIQVISANEYVVKRTDSREYFSIGPQEACLLELLDGRHNFQKIQLAYEHRFGTKLSSQDLKEFITAVEPMGLFRTPVNTSDKSRATATSGGSPQSSNGRNAVSSAEKPRKKKKLLQDQSLLFFRVPLFDPENFLTRLVRVIPFVWTKTFVIFAVTMMFAAMCVMISNSEQLTATILSSSGWGTAILFLTVMIFCTSMHEMAHGATLKYYGGEVHETGLLFMFFTPCMYCNVSDAWLIPEKWKRLTVTAAGAFCDLCQWVVGVFVWRLTVQGTLINSIAFMVLTICGGRCLINLNPLLRLDGYYLLGDWLAIPNLRPRALDYWTGHLRWFLWGAQRPAKRTDSRALLLYGFLCWCFALAFLDLIFIQFFEYMGGQFGATGLIFVALLLAFAFRRVFKGFFSSEFGTMLKSRPGRTTTWAVGVLGVVALLFLVPVRSTTSGDFEVRPGNVVQVHVPVAGVVKSVFVEDGSLVEEGQLLAELKSPLLESEITKTEDLLREVEANLRKLKAGARGEVLKAAEDKTRRMTEWYQLGVEDLEQAKLAHAQELLAQEHHIREITAELEHARQNILRSEQLYRQGALAGAQLRQERLQIIQIESRLAQTQAALSAFRTLGTRSREADLTRRGQELEDARDELKLLLAGSRPEEIAAEEARGERVAHELAFLKAQREKLQVRATASGIFAAPRLKERVGLAVPQDSLFCTIEKPETSRVEISVTEDEAALLKPGQPVSLKARAIPFETFEATVEGISATAQPATNTGQSVVVVHCQIRNPDGRLKSGMTGSGRVSRGWNSIGIILLTKGIRYLRT